MVIFGKEEPVKDCHRCEEGCVCAHSESSENLDHPIDNAGTILFRDLMEVHFLSR